MNPTDELNARPLIERKRRLRLSMPRIKSRLLYVDRLAVRGRDLFRAAPRSSDFETTSLRGRCAVRCHREGCTARHLKVISLTVALRSYFRESWSLIPLVSRHVSIAVAD